MIKHTIILLTLSLQLTGCKKMLETPPSSDAKTNQDLNQLAGLLNNSNLFGETPVLGEQSSGDYFLTPDYYATLSEIDKNIYIWEKDIFGSTVNISDWNVPFKQVNTSNVVLEELSKITPNVATQQQFHEIKGSALFMRSYAFYNISQVFAAVYYPGITTDIPGIPLPLTANIEVIPHRSTLQESYDQILNDLQTSTALLPAKISTSSRNLPNKPAAFALLARAYLSMSDFIKAGTYADSCLAYCDALINFNTLQLTSKFPITELNEETLYQSWLSSTSNVIKGKSIQGCIIDSALYNSYDTNDLRKQVFFTLKNNQPIFNCSYSGRIFPFSGLATDEVYLIRAECNARQGNIEKAMADLNKLITKRYKTGTFVPYQAFSKEEALKIILKERWKELVFRGTRWADLRRLNKEEANKITLSRSVGDSLYQLLPNSNRYVLPIPKDALMGGNILQNDRD